MWDAAPSDLEGRPDMPENQEVKAILARGRITADDVLRLRKQVFLKGVVTASDADIVFQLNDKLSTKADASWPPFFVEAIVDYIVTQAEPFGYISQENADWLIQRISRSGHVDTACELELLVKALERAKASPVTLVQFALQQVKAGVLEGDGYVGQNRKLEPGVVGEPDVGLVRRILYAFGGDGNVAVTQQEAEILFDINDATSEADNHPAWSDLFVKALANFLMAASGYQVPTRQEALRREAWLDTPTTGVDGFMSQMLAGSLGAIWDAYEHGTIDGEPRKPASSGGLTIGFEPRVTAAEADWAARRMGRDGLHENEMALINFLKGRQAHLHPKLVPILDLAAA
jgi:hypothetical protein